MSGSEPARTAGDDGLVEPSGSGLAQALAFSSGNPRIEETRGIMHLYPNDPSTSGLPVGFLGSIICRIFCCCCCYYYWRCCCCCYWCCCRCWCGGGGGEFDFAFGRLQFVLPMIRPEGSRWCVYWGFRITWHMLISANSARRSSLIFWKCELSGDHELFIFWLESSLMDLPLCCCCFSGWIWIVLDG